MMGFAKKKEIIKLFGYAIVTILGFILFQGLFQSLLNNHTLLIFSWLSMPILMYWLKFLEGISEQAQNLMANSICIAVIVLSLVVMSSPDQIREDFAHSHIHGYRQYVTNDCAEFTPEDASGGNAGDPPETCIKEDLHLVNRYWRVFLAIENWISQVLTLLLPILTIGIRTNR